MVGGVGGWGIEGLRGVWWANKENEDWDRVGRSERQIGDWQLAQSCPSSTLLLTFYAISKISH